MKKISKMMCLLLALTMVLGLAACGLATLWMAVFADVGVAVLAILNAMRALGKKPAQPSADDELVPAAAVG